MELKIVRWVCDYRLLEKCSESEITTLSEIFQELINLCPTSRIAFV